PESSCLDSARNNAFRWEIVAIHLLASCHQKDKQKVCNLLERIREGRNRDFFWDEYPYGLIDEVIGYSGSVPSSFILLSLTEAYRFLPSESLFHFIIETADAFCLIESNGRVRKAMINRGDVLNTNLIAAMGLKEVSGLLPDGSVRRRHYDEFVRRAVR